MRWALAPALFAVALGCAGPDPDAPPEIAYGHQECSHCRMIISEERFAAALQWADGEVARFDDIGCLLASMEARAEVPPKVWVHDADSVEWLDARTATFVLEEARTTPMGSGVVALTTEAAARQRVAESETIYDWDELVAAGVALRAPNEENRG